ncbi:hypothetical protein MNB_SV-14-1884 [hydrothermal vent metagenome]|uniref:DUF420 domain-containing protein n=1 Tax=hydrothermal vent metagenome TaxID=652676 RepID=A0A1W1CJ69_9ZZZZ
MEYLFDIGFLGTHAPYYMDIIIVYLFSLPILMTFSILLASHKKYTLHRFTQSILFLLTIFVLFSLNYGIYIFGEKKIFYLLIIEIFFSILLLIMWLSVLLFAVEDRRRRGLPGLYTQSHKKSGKRVFTIMLMTVFSSIYLYRMVYSA